MFSTRAQVDTSVHNILSLKHVPDSCNKYPWSKHIDTLRGFALVEVLRLTAHTACLSDFLSNLARLDEHIVKLLRSSHSCDNEFATEIQLRLFFYLSIYFQRLAKKKKVDANIHFLIESCLQRAAALKTNAPSSDSILSKSVWKHLYGDGLSLRLQSALLAKKSSHSQARWNVILLEALSQDSLSKNEQHKFEFLFGLEESVKGGAACLYNAEELYLKLLEYRPGDLSTILWYVLRPVKADTTSDTDLALPAARLRIIVDSVRQVFSSTPPSAENCKVCQLDAVVFLVALSISYLIRHTSSETSRGHAQAAPLSWPPQPLCLLNTRLLPSSMQRRCWNGLCACAKDKSADDESPLMHFIDQLRFVRPTQTMPARLILRVAQAITRLPLEASATDFTLARAARAWEAGLSALMQNSEFARLGSPAPSVRERYSDEGILFPAELNCDWWHGTHVDNLTTMTSKDQAWFFLGWRWLASYWLEHPPPKLETLISHLQYLRDHGLPTDVECILLAAKLVENAVGLSKTSPLIKLLGNLALSLLNTTLRSVQRTPFTDESTARPTRNLSDAITSLQKALELPNASAQSSEVQSTDPAQTQTMSSGYGAYANGGRTSIFGPYRSPGVTSSPAAMSATAAPNSLASDLQTKLMTQVVEQWMPSFTEFSRVMSETSAELAKSRLQNEELSRLLKETRNQLDTVIAEQQKQQQRNSTPVRQPSPPAQPVPSLEDWRALQESLREVASVLRDFRHWLPLAMPSFAPPPPPFPHPAHIPPPPPPPAQPSAMLRPGDIFTLENQQKAQLALSQLAAFQQQQQQQQMPRTTGGSCFLLPPPSYPPPTVPPPAVPVDFRVPSVATCLFPASISTSATFTSTSASSVDSPKVASSATITTAPIQSVKPPPTLPAASTGATATGLPKITPSPDSKQDTPPAEAASSPAPKPFPFAFKPAATTATDGFKTETSPLFSFSKFGSSDTAGTSALFGTLPFGHKPSVTSPSPCSPDVSKKAEEAETEVEDDEDKPEAFEPKVEFTPCVERLPELVQPITGEEGERVLFCHRARLFRWDKSDSSSNGEWKARGIGELKVLADDAAVKFRIVMRREQIMKLCANHYILPGINIKRHPQRAEACMWKARDFAVMDIDKPIPNGADELFMVHFKTEEITDEFEKIVKSCLEKASTVAPKNLTEKDPNEKEKPKPALITSCLEKLRPKAGSWTCATCALSVAQELEKCPACQAPKAGAKPTQHTSTSALPTFKFFSTPASSSSPAVSTSFVFGGGGGASINQLTPTPPPKFIFGNAPAPTAETDKLFSFSTLNTSETKTVGSASGAFANLDLAKNLEKPSTVFAFKMKPPTPVKSKNIDEAKKAEEGKDTTTDFDDNEEDDVTPSDLSQISFKPVVEHLPDKVEVHTGEEDEEVIFEARAKLFRFDTTVWKERGLGQLKLLRSPASGRVRIVMRREQVHKVCCNHPITSGMTLKPMEGSKALVVPWVWWAVDFSDDEVGAEGRKEMFSVRFKTLEESQAFHDAFVKAAAASGAKAPADLEVEGDELVIVENPLSLEQVARARALQLPDDFYAYELKKPGSSSRHSQREDLTPAEEAEEDALLEAAVNRGTSSTSSSLVVVKSTESLVITTSSTSPPPTFSATTSALQSLRGKPGSWTCESCSLLVDPEKTVCPACQAAKPGTSKPSKSDGFKGFSGTLFGSGGGCGSFEALSKDASAKPSWLTAPGSSSSPSPWAGAGSTLFSAKGDDKDDNDDDNESDPDPQFEPIIPLPNLVETKTGEEEEVCLFLRRCKLYRRLDNQWKERGIGDMKVLVHPKNPPPAHFLDPRTELPADKSLKGGINHARLLMRRDHVLKICANQTISLDMPQFKPLIVANYGVCWVAKDYSENPDGEVMTLGLRFKTEQDLTHFRASIERAREMLKRTNATS
ncbi:E3 SUMO protein ligase RanBP2 [Echinococcus multilocularis]|uniref:E3 SUMO protein ligase RanBP2 n=1 Tax=Echinococcus multilocularis TaxID=6211 RepID=A0A068Y9F1_ECHMU|nr:E3 SUMO protein ligase RanBP2 [Echinococcus multilocularis]